MVIPLKRKRGARRGGVGWIASSLLLLAMELNRVSRVLTDSRGLQNIVKPQPGNLLDLGQRGGAFGFG